MSDSNINIDRPLKELLQYLTSGHFLLKSSTSTLCSTLYHESNDPELVCILNCDLAINDLTTFNTAG